LEWDRENEPVSISSKEEEGRAPVPPSLGEVAVVVALEVVAPLMSLSESVVVVVPALVEKGNAEEEEETVSVGGLASGAVRGGGTDRPPLETCSLLDSPKDRISDSKSMSMSLLSSLNRYHASSPGAELLLLLSTFGGIDVEVAPPPPVGDAAPAALTNIGVVLLTCVEEEEAVVTELDTDPDDIRSDELTNVSSGSVSASTCDWDWD
jgi:hypothetical protein